MVIQRVLLYLLINLYYIFSKKSFFTENFEDFFYNFLFSFIKSMSICITGEPLNKIAFEFPNTNFLRDSL